MSNIPRISVILPFYNAESTLGAAVASIGAQSFTDWEMIAFDDGSTDDSREIAESLSAEDDRVRVVASPHVGIVRALSEGCAMARGEFLARMDADDKSAPLRFEKQLALFAADSELALCGTQVNMMGASLASGRRRYERWLNALVTHEDMVRELFVECPIAHPTFMMRRAAYISIGGYEDHGWPEDYDLIMRCWQGGFKLGKVDEALFDWHDSATRLSMHDARYDETSFRALKRHYLLGSYLQSHESFYQWGAGEVGKRWLREWGSRCPTAVVDIHPRKIGTNIHGFEIIAPEQLPPPEDVFVLVAVGAPGARDEIRQWFDGGGYEEGEQYLFVA